MNFDFFKKGAEKPKKNSIQRVHLDYASTTPVHGEVFEAMRPYFCDEWANPSAIYREGVKAREVVESARTEIARLLHVRPDGITFTSGGTESNNLAIVGYIEKLHDDGVAYGDMEIITTRIEHPSVLKTVQYLEKRGVRAVYAPVTEEGLIDVRAFPMLCTSKTVLVTFAYVNSEVGTVQDVKKITRAVRAWNEKNNARVRVHVDACQAPLWLPCELDMLGADMLSLDAGKCYGPKGIGVLARRHGAILSPITHGGGQEGGLRSGTENTTLIVGCARALVRAQGEWKSRSFAVAKLRDFAIGHISDLIPEAKLNGSLEHRVPNNINISLRGIDTEYAVIWLDAQGIAASTKSACGSGAGAGSTVVREMTDDDARARATLRLTLGEETTKQDLDTAIAVLRDFVVRMR